ncbi:MAG: LD-carboxypeptidase [Planctomycetota bacterium]|nr:MAG: LD-carboxypeptidase [Planctomycetota bacterium]
MTAVPPSPAPICHLLAPAYGHIAEEAHSAMAAQVQPIAQAMGWQLHWHESSKGRCLPGHWCDREQRLLELRQAFLGDVLWPVRGGYGCTHLLPALQASRRRAAPLLIGFSDITFFHCLWLRRGWGVSYYALMPAVPSGQRGRESLLRLLSHGRSQWGQEEVNTVTIGRDGMAQGPCFAACLSILAHCCGTAAMPSLDNHILFLEDIDEPPYAIDRNLWQLWHAGHLRNLHGIVWGRFPGCQHHHGPSLHDIIMEWVERLHIPSMIGLPFGHDPDPIAIPCGGHAQLSCKASHWRLQLSSQAIE